MTKSRKSKILALALCAGVMSGIYASPVMARNHWKPVNDQGSVTIHHYELAAGNDSVTITGIASQDAIDKVDEKVDGMKDTVDKINEAYESGALKGEQGEKGEDGKNGQDGKDGVDGKDGASIASGEYNVQDGTGIVQMPIEDKDGNKVGDVQINNIASQNDLKDETVAREEADAAHDQAIGDLEVENDKQDSAIAGLDALLKEETTARQEADNEIKADLAQETNDREVADKIESTLREWGDEQLQENIEAEAEKREEADKQIKDDLKQETVDRIAGDNALNNAINKETVEREAADAQLQQSIDNHEEAMGVSNKTELEAAYDGATYIDKNDTMVEADRKLDAAISDVSTRVDGLENRVDGLEDRIDKVGAMSAAIANLRTMGYDPAAPTEVAVGVGQYRDETGMALGLFHYPNRDFMLSLSVSTSGDEYMGGIGATWKFGRKSPEKVAEIKKAQEEADLRRAEEAKLAKAEEMKKAAKEAKVQAQMERHAKMAAERAALEEA